MSGKNVAEDPISDKIKTKSFARNTLLMSSLTSISRITGFARIMSILFVIGGATIGGLGRVADSYNLANVIPNYIYELVLGGILSSIIIPIFIEYLNKKGEKEAFKIASIIINLTLITLGTIAIIGTLIPNYIVKGLTSLSGRSDTSLAIFFFRFFAIQVVFYGLGAMCTGILYSYRRFGIPTFAPILNNLTVIFTLLFLVRPNLKTNPKFALIALAVGTTAGVLMMLLVQIPSLIRVGFRYVPSLEIRHPAIKQSIKMALPLFLYVLGNTIPMWVEVSLSWSYTTGVTALQSAWPFFQLPFGIFAVSVVNALFPTLSENATKGDWEEFKKQVSLGLRTIGMIMWPASIALIVLSHPIIALALRHGRLSSQEAALIANVLSYFSFGLFFFAGFYFLLRAFYARQDTFTPALISLGTMVFNIAIDFFLVKVLSVQGLALGRSLTYFLSFNIIWLMLSKRVGKLDVKIVTSNLKFFSASAVMGLVIFYSLQGMTPFFGGQALQNRFMLFSIPAVLGSITYISAIVLFRSPEIELVRKLLKRKQ